MKKIITITITLLIIMSFFSASTVLATHACKADGSEPPGEHDHKCRPVIQSTGGDITKTLTNPLKGTNTITELIAKITDWLAKTLAPIVVTIMVIVGAYQILFAAGDVEKIKTGRKTIVYAVVGYALVLIGLGITGIIESLLK